MAGEQMLQLLKKGTWSFTMHCLGPSELGGTGCSNLTSTLSTEQQAMAMKGTMEFQVSTGNSRPVFTED